jgi:hypothetical protein
MAIVVFFPPVVYDRWKRRQQLEGTVPKLIEVSETDEKREKTRKSRVSNIKSIYVQKTDW